MSHSVPEEVCSQIRELHLWPHRPLIITDADEVLFAFVEALERFLEREDYVLKLETFALTGNIRYRESGEPVPAADVRDLIATFFERHTEEMEPVAGAAAALASLAERAQIVVLSNVPLHQRAARKRALQAHGMDYPLIANIGRKGGAVAMIAEAMKAPTFFIDDIPHNIISVAEAAADVVRLHFVADARLARLLDTCEQAHARTDDWPAAQDFILGHLERQGY